MENVKYSFYDFFQGFLSKLNLFHLKYFHRFNIQNKHLKMVGYSLTKSFNLIFIFIF